MISQTNVKRDIKLMKLEMKRESECLVFTNLKSGKKKP